MLRSWFALAGVFFMSEKDKIEVGNLMEEASVVFDECIRCGMCKAICPVFRVMKEEEFSARGKGDLLHDKIMDKIVFQCTLCGACEKSCPLGIKVCDAVRKAREAMVLKGKGLSENEEMMKNVRKMGNPFGKMSEKDKEKLYCC